MRNVILKALVLTLPITGALLMYAWAWLTTEGYFLAWEPLGHPPGTVTALTARFRSVWATLEDGTLYWAAPNTDCRIDCWQSAAEIPPYRPGGYPTEDCILPAVGADVRLVASLCESMGAGGLQLTVFALRADGGVWVWQQTSGGESLLLLFLAPMFGGLAGLGLMVIIFLTGEFSEPWRKNYSHTHPPKVPRQPWE